MQPSDKKGARQSAPCSDLRIEFAPSSIEQLLLSESCPWRLIVSLDEAHLVTQWGRRFRTSYLSLGDHKREVGRGSAFGAVLVGPPPPLVLLSCIAVVTGYSREVGGIGRCFRCN